MDIHDLFVQSKSQVTLKIEAQLIEALKKVPQYATLKGEVHFIVMAMNFVEYLCKGHKIKADKKAIVIKVLTGLFSLNAAEVLLLENNIQSLFDLNVIKIPTIFKIFKTFVFSIFKKKTAM